jgi:hypothetical protein
VAGGCEDGVGDGRGDRDQRGLARAGRGQAGTIQPQDLESWHIGKIAARGNRTATAWLRARSSDLSHASRLASGRLISQVLPSTTVLLMPATLAGEVFGALLDAEQRHLGGRHPGRGGARRARAERGYRMWWADPLAALVIMFYAPREARTIFRPGPAATGTSE